MYITKVNTIELINSNKSNGKSNINKIEFATYLQKALGTDFNKVKNNKKENK